MYGFNWEEIVEAENVLEQTEFYCRIVWEASGHLIIFDLFYDRKSVANNRLNLSMTNLVHVKKLAETNLNIIETNAI